MLDFISLTRCRRYDSCFLKWYSESASFASLQLEAEADYLKNIYAERAQKMNVLPCSRTTSNV